MFFADLEAAGGSVSYSLVGSLGCAFMEVEVEAFRLASPAPHILCSPMLGCADNRRDAATQEGKGLHDPPIKRKTRKEPPRFSQTLDDRGAIGGCGPDYRGGPGSGINAGPIP